MKILLTGQSGQLGNLLAPALSPHTEVISVSRQTMDLADLDQIRDAIRSIQPDLIINPAAYTAVVKAETDIAGATRINAEAPEIMAQEAQRIGAGLVHYSTDYVFDGTNSAPYTEQDTPNPINVYGQTKFAGELAIQRHCDAYWVFRTSWVYSISGGNFLKTIIRLAQEKDTFTMNADQFGAPTWAQTISDMTLHALLGKKQRPSVDQLRNTSGVYHLTAAGETSWHQYAQFIVSELLRLQVPLKIKHPAAITPVGSDAQPALLQRPKSSRLNSHKLESTFDVVLPHWQTDVATCLRQLVDHYQLTNGKPLPPA